MIETGVWRKIRIARKLVLLAPAFLIGLPAQWLALKTSASLARSMPVIFHRYVLWVMQVKMHRIGQPDARRPLLIVANHLSWLDILVISAQFPVSFIAKSEVATWPIFGTLARLQRSVFVERARRDKTAEVNHAIASRMQQGDAMVLFAEGTTSDGTRILPFRSALIGAAQTTTAQDGQSAYVQALNIAYPEIAGLPTGRAGLPFIAWYGDMDLLPHLMDFLSMESVSACITLGELRKVEPGSDRKALTKELEAEVRRHHSAALRGRLH